MSNTNAMSMNRFFQSEVRLRWQTDQGHVAALDGSRGQLIRFLRDHFEFSVRRAELEADQLFRTLKDRLRLAID